MLRPIQAAGAAAVIRLAAAVTAAPDTYSSCGRINMPRFAEISSNKVRFVLPAESAQDYPVLVPGQVEIEIEADVVEGDTYDSATGEFRHQTSEEKYAESIPRFNSERCRRFNETDWIRQRHQDRLELGIDDSENWAAWLAYWQALRDMPEQEGFDPADPEWPEMPE
jgi:hypothetical protein